jgi:integrase
LTYDEAKKLVTWCLARPTDAGAVATLAAYWLGVRATELTSSTVRDLDAGATLLDITDAKTEAGDRTLRLPCKLQPLVKALADGKQPGDFLFGDVDRHWLLRQVRRCCEGAGVPVVSPHGLRGSHAKHAREVGVSGSSSLRPWGTRARRRPPTTTPVVVRWRTLALTVSPAWCIKSGAPMLSRACPG